MNRISNFIVAAACSLGMALSAMPAEATSAGVPTVGGVPVDQIQTVDHRRGGGHGGRHGGRGGWGNHGGGHHNGGWRGDRRGYYGRGHGGHRSHTGRYVAAGVLGLAAGAAIAGSSRNRNCRYVRGGQVHYRPC